MSIPEGWGKCTIPQVGSEEYKRRFCDPNKEKVKKETTPPNPDQPQPEQLPQADAGNREYPDPEWKADLMRDSGGD